MKKLIKEVVVGTMMLAAIAGFLAALVITIYTLAGK